MPQSLGLGAVSIENVEFSDTKLTQRESDRLADPACADQRDRAISGSRDEIGDGERKSGPVGVVADQAAAPQHYGINGADSRRAGRQFVE